MILLASRVVLRHLLVFAAPKFHTYKELLQPLSNSADASIVPTDVNKNELMLLKLHFMMNITGHEVK
jgi:hypothetical protein